LVADAVPNFTTDVPVNALPVMVTVVPPAVGPEVGLTLVTTGRGGGAVYVNWSFAVVALVPAPGTVTVMSTVPVPAGAVAVIVDALFTVNPVAAVAPNFTADAFVNAVPVMVTEVPPPVGPDDGVTLVTVGTGGGAT
jgi:hypothetical protein